MVLLCALFLVCTSCATAPIGFSPGPSGDFVHIHSGMRFPKTVGHFNRDMTHVFDGAGYDIAVGYDLDHPFKVVVTVYTYPAEGRTLENGFDRVTNDIKEAHPDAVRISESDMPHSHGGETIAGKSATFAFRGDGQELVSGAYLFEYGRWFIAYRATYERQHQTEAAREVEDFINALPWPVLF